MYDAEIKGYFESLGFCVNARPGAAQVAAVFQELCKMRSLGTLPKEAKWFDSPLRDSMMRTKRLSKTSSGSCTAAQVRDKALMQGYVFVCLHHTIHLD
jgi:hypothetical protein